MPVGKNQLTPRQRKFAAEYHVLCVSPDCDDPVAEAARRAGFAAKSAHSAGSRVLHKDKVQAELARLSAEVAERHKIDEDYFVREFQENHRLARAGMPVLSRNGDPIMRPDPITGTDEPLMKVDITGSNKALETLAKITGFMTERHDVTTRRHIDDMDEAELAAERKKLDVEIARLKANDGNVVPLRAVGDDD